MSNLDIKLTALADYHLDQLEDEWRDLHQRSEATFFLSWNWIGSWLSILPSLQPCHLVQAFQQGQLVAMGIFYERQTRRHGFVKSTQWHLHRTGDDKLDQIWIEYNDFLIAPSPSTNCNNNLSCDDIREQMWQSILKSQQSSQHVDEFVVGLVHKNVSEHLNDRFVGGTPSFTLLIDDNHPSFYLALKQIDLASYPKLISKSAFKAIKKTEQLLVQHGRLESVSFELHDDIANAIEQGKKWHIEKWDDTKTPSGFTNEHFNKFHHHLCTANSLQKGNNNRVVVIALTLDSHIIGFNYVFVDDHKMSFYLSCIKPSGDNRVRIGLLLHKEAIKVAKSMNLKSYDFLAGASRYKKQLSNNMSGFSFVTFQRKSFTFNVENLLKKMKTYLVRN